MSIAGVKKCSVEADMIGLGIGGPAEPEIHACHAKTSFALLELSYHEEAFNCQRSQ